MAKTTAKDKNDQTPAAGENTQPEQPETKENQTPTPPATTDPGENAAPPSDEALPSAADIAAMMSEIRTVSEEMKKQREDLAKREEEVAQREAAAAAGIADAQLPQAGLEVEPKTREQLAEEIKNDYFNAEVLKDPETGEPVKRKYPKENKKGDPVYGPNGDPLYEERLVIVRPPLSYAQIAQKYAPWHISISDVVRVIEGPNSQAYKTYRKLENPSDPDGAVNPQFLANPPEDTE